jgi:hypothetical protein
MSVNRAQQEIDAQEFAFWLAYHRMHGIDTEGWEQTAMQCSVVANVNGAKTKPQDFMPTVKPKQSTQTPQEMIAVMEGLFSGRDN